MVLKSVDIVLCNIYAPRDDDDEGDFDWQFDSSPQCDLCFLVLSGKFNVSWFLFFCFSSRICSH